MTHLIIVVMMLVLILQNGGDRKMSHPPAGVPTRSSMEPLSSSSLFFTGYPASPLSAHPAIGTHILQKKSSLEGLSYICELFSRGNGLLGWNENKQKASLYYLTYYDGETSLPTFIYSYNTTLIGLFVTTALHDTFACTGGSFCFWFLFTFGVRIKHIIIFGIVRGLGFVLHFGLKAL